MKSKNKFFGEWGSHRMSCSIASGLSFVAAILLLLKAGHERIKIAELGNMLNSKIINPSERTELIQTLKSLEGSLSNDLMLGRTCGLLPVLILLILGATYYPEDGK